MREDIRNASVYLQKEWQKLTKEVVPPQVLLEGVIKVVSITGYTKKQVDKLIEGYRKQS